MPTSTSTDLKHWLTVVAGLDPGLLERSTLDHWVDQRLAQLRLSDVQGYLRVLRENGDELERLVAEISVPETWFFRYPASFRLLIEFARQLRTSTTSPEALRMLSIACATGEEPYSMAMSAVHAGWPFSRIVVDAVDRNHRWLEMARQATYGQRSLREAPPDWAEAWLLRSDDGAKVDPQVVSAVNFVRADVLDVASADTNHLYDVIFCRNLLIYLNGEAQKSLISRIVSRLLPHGLLFVGHAESLDSFQSQFRRVSTPHAFALHLRPAGGQEPSNRTPLRPHRRSTSAVRKSARTATKRSRPIDTPALPPVPAGLSNGPPADAEATLDQARALADAGELALSLAIAKSVLAADGPTAGILELLGHIHLALGDLSDAHDALTKALYFEPDREDVLLQLSMIYQRMGDDLQAERYRQRAARSHQMNQSER